MTNQTTDVELADALARMDARRNGAHGDVMPGGEYVLLRCKCGWSVELPASTKQHVCETCGNQMVIE